MKRYSQLDEKQIRAQAMVREWKNSGLLEASQAVHLETGLRVDLRRTNPFLRTLLFGFTAIIVIASLALIFTTMQPDGKVAKGVVCLGGAIACFVLAEFLVSRFRLYRFGVEEALTVASAVLLSTGGALIWPGDSDRFRAFVALAAGAICGVRLYASFGYVYCAVASMICTAAIPSTLTVSGEWERILAAMICGVIFVMIRPRRLLWDDDFPGDDYAIIQAMAWIGIYVTLNVKLTFSPFTGWFLWSTYLMTWFLPVFGLWLALRTKDRLLIQVNLAMQLATLATNKLYLGLPRKPWDPILLGVLLMGTAIVIKRWLSRGTDQQLSGYVATRILASDGHILSMVGTASAALQPHAPTAPPSGPKPDFGGGRSGGAGASGSF